MPDRIAVEFEQPAAVALRRGMLGDQVRRQREIVGGG
jgi:hypothetical protein